MKFFTVVVLLMLLVIANGAFEVTVPGVVTVIFGGEPAVDVNFLQEADDIVDLQIDAAVGLAAGEKIDNAEGLDVDILPGDGRLVKVTKDGIVIVDVGVYDHDAVGLTTK